MLLIHIPEKSFVSRKQCKSLRRHIAKKCNTVTFQVLLCR